MTHILVNESKTEYKIVHKEHADEATKYAAAELSMFLKEIFGAAFPVFDDNSPASGTEIWVGQSERTRGLNLEWSVCETEGYYTKSFENNLLLAGNTGRANLYAVYDFLEESLGCRWFTAEVSKIPRKKTLSLPELDRQFTPILEYREPYFVEAFDGDWAARSRINGKTARLLPRHGGQVKYKGFVHTFESLLPSAQYFDEHPEYYAEIDGRRRKKGDGARDTQLCLSNPEVLRLVTQKVLDWLAEMPEANIISVSQNDSTTPCRCANCRKIDEEEGSYAGTLLRFVNSVAEEVEKHYPDVAIDTLAYRYSRRAPKLTKPRKNVIIRLCSIECCFTHPLGTCPDVEPADTPDSLQSAGGFVEDLEAWKKICDRIYIWDYLIDFPFSLMPYPNVEVLSPNIKFFIENHARGIFAQGGGHTRGTFAGELKAYVVAKCLWNPDYDAEKAVSEFYDAVYGRAAGVMRRIYDAYRNEVENDGIHLGFDIHIDRLYNRAGFLESLEELYDKAESLADDEAVLQRIKKARLCQRFTVLIKTKDHRALAAQAEMDAFAADCAAFGVTKFDEGHTMEAWVSRWKRSRFND